MVRLLYHDAAMCVVQQGADARVVELQLSHAVGALIGYRLMQSPGIGPALRRVPWAIEEEGQSFLWGR